LYVCSQAGVSRSATIVLAYLMTIGDYDLEKALQIVKGARGYIHPNPGFISQLRRYHAYDVKKVFYLKVIIYTFVLSFELELVSFNTTLS
jgi:protein-tyrosine phosphatase